MIGRGSIGRSARCGLCLRPHPRRGLAAAASGSFTYQAGEVNGVKYASRDLPGPMTTVAVVARGGTRFEPASDLSIALERFAFKSTEKRSALRITREVELLGGQLMASRKREGMVIGAKFLREDLPYFVELLSEVISKTRYTRHEFVEEVAPGIVLQQNNFASDPIRIANDSVHGVAFHRGLGNPLAPLSLVPSKDLNHTQIGVWGAAVYAPSNFALVANGADHSEFSKWAKEFFSDIKPSAIGSTPTIKIEASKYYGGEERIARAGPSAMALAFPGSSNFTGTSWKPEVAVLAALLGGKTTIKWSPGFSLLSKLSDDIPGLDVSTLNNTYSDTGLMTVILKGSPKVVTAGAKATLEVLKKIATQGVSQEEFEKAVATARFTTLELGESLETGLESTGSGLLYGGKPHQIDELSKSFSTVTKDQVTKAAVSLLEEKASVSAVGDLRNLPYAEEIGLKI